MKIRLKRAVNYYDWLICGVIKGGRGDTMSPDFSSSVFGWVAVVSVIKLLYIALCVQMGVNCIEIYNYFNASKSQLLFFLIEHS